jgi:hypothetical protein
MDHLVRSTLHLIQFECNACNRLVYVNDMNIKQFKDFLCSYCNKEQQITHVLKTEIIKVM